MTADAVVVGGSVAGCATAIHLARRGFRVDLYEKARFPRPKACGEGLLPHGVEALAELGIAVRGPRVRGLRFVSPSGATAEADFPSGHGRVVRRERFDAALFRAAAATPGVRAFEATAWTPDRRARWTIGADGLRSLFHRRPEFPAAPPSLRRTGLTTHARGLDVDPERVEVLIHEAGELYLAPSDDGEALVAGLYRRLPEGRTAEERLRATLLSLAVLRGRVRGLAFTTPVLAASPLGLRVGAVASEDTLLVGDAAGAPDPVTGEGLSLALRCARAAADAIAAGDPFRYATAHRQLASGADWLGKWLLRATRYPTVADRVVDSLSRRPELFAKLLEIATGARRAGDLTWSETAMLLV